MSVSKLMCPKCGLSLISDKSMFLGNFVCPSCRERLKMVSGASNLALALGVLISLSASLLMGTREIKVAILTGVLFLPSYFISSFLVGMVVPSRMISMRKQKSGSMSLFDKNR